MKIDQIIGAIIEKWYEWGFVLFTLSWEPVGPLLHTWINHNMVK